MGLVDSEDILDDMFLPGSRKTEQNVGKFAPKPGGKFRKPLSKKAKPFNAPNAIEVNLGKDADIVKSDAVAKIAKLCDLTSEIDADFMKLTPVKEPSKLMGEIEVLSGDGSENVFNATRESTDSLAAPTIIFSDHSFVEEPTQVSREFLVLAEPSHVSEENEVSAGFGSFEVEADPLCHSSTVTPKSDEQAKNKYLPKRHSQLTTSESASYNSDAFLQNSSTGVHQSGSQCSETETSLQHDSDNIQQDLDLTAMSVLPSDLAVKQHDMFQPKSALCLKKPKNKSVSFNLPVETENSPSHKRGLDLNMTPEPIEDNLFNREDSSLNMANEQAEFSDNDEEFESIDEIMNIDSWDEPIPTILEKDGANQTPAGLGKGKSVTRTCENDNPTKNDMNEANVDDDTWTTNDMNDPKKTTKRKSKSSKESDPQKTTKRKSKSSKESDPKKIPDNDEDFESIDEIRDTWTTNDISDTKKTTKRKSKSSKESDPTTIPDNDEDFESIDEIRDIDSWDELSIPTKLENGGADKTSSGSRKRNSTRRTFENDNHTKNDSVDMGYLNESNDDDDTWTANDMNGAKKTTKRKRKSSKESDPKKVPDNDEEFESIDEIMDIDSWDEPSIPTKLENGGADKTSGGSRKRNSARRTFENHSGHMGYLNELDDDTWTMNDTKKTTKRKSSKKLDSETIKEPKKRIPHGTRRKRRQVEKALLEKAEHGLDPTRLPIRDLILIAGAKERISSKEAAISMPNSNNSLAGCDNPLDEGFDPDSEEAHRHWLKHAKKVNYQTHMKISRSPRWSKEDTELFYEAIRDFKTNFGMMGWLFPGRTSRQLKAKFKVEERKHPLELRDALEFRSKDYTLFGKVIEIMKEQKKTEDAAYNETEEEIGVFEMEENAGTRSNQNADNNDKTDPWNDGDYDFNEFADLELDADVSFTQNMEEKVDNEKEKQVAYNCEDEVDNPEKKDLWDDDFESLEFNECEDLELETDAASIQFEEKIDEKQ